MTNSLHKILLTGGDGQVARAIAHLQPTTSTKIINCNKQTLDVTSIASIRTALALHKPDVIINTAAYTAVDKAEEEFQLAININADGAKNLAIVCNDLNIDLIHLSTDYVFDGNQQLPYTETDTTNPVNKYGQSKLIGEENVLAHNPNAVVIRLSAVFSNYGSNFVKTILRLAAERDTLQIIDDQFTCPTSANEIALILQQAARQKLNPGLYHFCSRDVVSWYEFAFAILSLACDYSNKYKTIIRPIAAATYISAAKRPTYSVLCSDKISTALNVPLPSWQNAIQHIVPELIRMTNEL